MMDRVLRCLVASAAIALFPQHALACSPADGEEFETPSSFDLVRQADLIVLGRVSASPADTEFLDAMLLEPVEVLKGALPDRPLLLPGQSDWNGKTIEPIVTPLVENHFSAGLGACIRMFYQPGELVVAILYRSPETGDEADGFSPYFPYADPSSRSVESVTGADDIWVEAVKLYTAIAAGPGDHRRQLEEARDTMRLRGDFAGNAIANDIAWALSHEEIYPYWDSFNLPEGSLAYLRDPLAKEQVTLVCAVEEGGVRLVAGHGSAFDLTIGDASFAARDVQKKEIPGEFGGRDNSTMISSGFADPEAIMNRLMAKHETVGVRIDGQVFASAPPGDVLLRWSQRCGQILADGAEKGP